jgi:hypothetical protein
MASKRFSRQLPLSGFLFEKQTCNVDFSLPVVKGHSINGVKEICLAVRQVPTSQFFSLSP